MSFWGAFSLGVLAVSIIFLYIFVLLIRKKTLEVIEKRDFLSPSEVDFWHHLRKALPGYNVFPQVSMNALIKTTKELPEWTIYNYREAFNRKYVDYVVCKYGKLEVIAIIELDGDSHRWRLDDDLRRDEMLERAGYKVLRYKSKKPFLPEAQILEDVKRVQFLPPHSSVP